MAENEFQFLTPANFNYAVDIINNSTIVEEGPKICPMCSSVVRMYYVEFNTKLYMCTNLECVYPFGDNYTVYSSDDDGRYLAYGQELTSMCRKRYTRSNRSAKSVGLSSRSTSTSAKSMGISSGSMSTSSKSMGLNSGGASTSVKSSGMCSAGTSTLGTNSNLSSSEWSDLNRSSHTYDSDDNDSMISMKTFKRRSSQRQLERRAKKLEDERHIKQNVEKIKECNKYLFEGEDVLSTIRNEKWIKNLSAMQSSTGMKLVKERELQKLKNNQSNICHRDLKIDIASEKDAISSIVIEIGNISQVANKQIKK